MDFELYNIAFEILKRLAIVKNYLVKKFKNI